MEIFICDFDFYVSCIIDLIYEWLFVSVWVSKKLFSEDGDDLFLEFYDGSWSLYDLESFDWEQAGNKLITVLSGHSDYASAQIKILDLQGKRDFSK